MTNNPTHKAKTLTGTWIEGWYDNSTGNHTMWIQTLTKKFVEEINPTTLCRSTYRPDSNGKMMYEGDRIDVKEWEDGMRNISGEYTIEWDCVGCCFCLIAEGREALEFNEMDYYYSTGRNKHD